MELFKIFGTIGAKNDEALSKIRETTKEADSASGKLQTAFSKANSGISKGLKVIGGFGAATAGGIAAIFGLSEATAEYTEDMGKLQTAFQTAGKTSEQATNTYRGMVGILGETDQAVEASNHLAQLCTSEQELSDWTTIAAGVYATFGDSLPLEGLTEAANETAKVGQVTGPLADAINWASASTEQWSAALSGHSGAQAAFNAAVAQGQSKEDAFNAALAACNSEQERSQLITQTLNSLYGEAGAKYQELNADLIASRQAQSDFNGAMAEAGNAVRPIQTGLLQLGTTLLTAALPYIQQFGDWFKANLPTIQQTVQTVIGQIGATIQTLQPIIQPVLNLLMQVFGWIITNLPTIAPIVLGVVTAFMGLQGVISIITGIYNAFMTFKTGITLVTTAFNLLKVAFAANPFGLIVMAITTVITILITLWNTNEGFRNAVMTAWNAISTAATTIFNAIASFLSGIWNTISSVASSVWNGISSFLSGVWNGISSTVTSVFNGISSFISGIWNTISGIFSTVINTISSIISNGFNTYRNYISNVLNAISSVISSVWNTISSIISGVVNTIGSVISSGFNAAKNTVSSVFNGIKSTIDNVINTAKNIVKSGIDGIVGFFRGMKLEFPKIKLPHFSISGSFSLNPPSIPKFGIEWYKKGGIFDQPTLFNTSSGLKGVGEAGAEAVTPISVLRTYVREEVAAANAGLNESIDRLYNLLGDYLPELLDAQRKDIVLDTGVLVGETAVLMDKRLGNIARKRERGQ